MAAKADFEFNFGPTAGSGSFNFYNFCLKKVNDFELCTREDINEIYVKSNNLRQALKNHPKASQKSCNVNVTMLSRGKKDPKFVTVYYGGQIDPDSYSYKRFMAVVAYKAITDDIQINNPLAERAGLPYTDRTKLFYALFCPGTEFLFCFYPEQVVAIEAYRYHHADQLGIKLQEGMTAADMYRTLARQMINTSAGLVTASTWLAQSENQRKVREAYDFLTENATGGVSSIHNRAVDIANAIDNILNADIAVAAPLPSKRVTFRT